MSVAIAMSLVICAAPGAPAEALAPSRFVNPSLRLALAAPAPAPTPADLALRRASFLDEEPAPDDAEASGRDESRQRTLRTWERRLKWGTAGALVLTSTLGTLAAINQPTAFGDGRCQTGHPVFGDYGCNRGLSTLHGASGVLSATLYTADAALALAIRGPVGHVSPAARPWHRALTYIHLGGIVVQPILGLITVFPQVIGVNNTAPGDRFPRNMRTAHLTIGYLTAAAFLATLALEL
ncbi:hypothetical protein [Anaeromyxobacter oryzisoli]|uniref:hypothetical protein n=1 Tax=Anaeromyxobacter oryzisoli TaxID=2925408 RepID=UPI001F58B858|nr:hypothetical protein [Anaeromyxobacter sp. SG63]